LAVTGLRGIASTGGVLVPAQELGKYKTIFQMFALEALLLHYRYPIPGTQLAINFHAAGMLFLWMALVLAVWSGVDYHVRILRHVRWIDGLRGAALASRRCDHRAAMLAAGEHVCPM